MKRNRKMKRIGLAVIAGSALLGSNVDVSALPPGSIISNSIHSLGGVTRGLDENLVEDGSVVPVGAALYTAPNGAVSGALGTEGMTESIFTSARPGAPTGGLNVPQPMLIDAALGGGGTGTDLRADHINPLTGDATWGARAALVTTWTSIANTGNILLPPSGSVTGVITNMTPGAVTSSSGTPLFDGLAPGSVAADPFPDTIPFLPGAGFGANGVDFSVAIQGRDAATALIHGLAPNAAGIAAIPAPFIPIVTFYEQDLGGGATLLEIPDTSPDNLRESDWGGGFGVGPTLGNSAHANDNVAPLLIGELFGVVANQEIRELEEFGLPTGVYILDVSFSANVIYTGGQLVTDGKVAAGSIGGYNSNWQNILFPDDIVANAGGTADTPWGAAALFSGGTDYNGLAYGPSYDRNGLEAYDFYRESFLLPGGTPVAGNDSASQSFVTRQFVPEPISAGLGMMGIGALGASLRRRR